jgi:CobQ-like glutamine amidotransferase family enzyme
LTADVYLLGGGEDSAMGAAHHLLQEERRFSRLLQGGSATCLAVCAGFQILSRSFCGPDGSPRPGLDVLDAECRRLPGPRAVGEVVVEPTAPLREAITGFENHQGDARLGPAAMPLGVVRRGHGNGVGGYEGARQGRVVATYLHGPVLVRNPELADHLLGIAIGEPLPPWYDASVARLRRERLVRSGRGRGRLAWARSAGP